MMTGVSRQQNNSDFSCVCVTYADSVTVRQRSVTAGSSCPPLNLSSLDALPQNLSLVIAIATSSRSDMCKKPRLLRTDEGRLIHVISYGQQRGAVTLMDAAAISSMALV
jgi:hypothetical protein